MIKEVADRDVVAAYVREAKRQLLDGTHDEAAARAAAALGLPAATAHDAARRFAQQLPDDGLGPETDPHGQTPFVSRDPLVSLIQTSLQEEVAGSAQAPPPGHPQHGLFSRVWPAVEDFVEEGRLKQRGVELGAAIVEGMLRRCTEGTHPFNPEPAERELSDRARLVLVGDWGSGTRQAHDVAGLMAGEVTAGVGQGREVHVIHLGDVYFAGEEEEYRHHVLADTWWPVNRTQADAGVGSWSLAGNHDLYGGARAYFTVLLGDGRFRLQRSADEKPTSWFRLRSPSWQVIGLDSSWDDEPFSRGQTGQLADPQAQRVAAWLGEDDGRKRLVLSHHQFVTVYDQRLLGAPATPALVQQMAPHVDRGAITAWIWGHEHRCMAFNHHALPFPRCLGHGGQLLASHVPAAQRDPRILWEETASFALGEQRWGRCGFAVLDLDGPRIDVRYVLAGAQPVVATERFQ